MTVDKVRRSFALSLTQSYVVLGMQFLTSVIIARLLTPSEIGVFSVSIVLVAFANTVRDFGVTDYIVQEKELTRDRIRSALAVSIGLGWIIAAAILVLSFAASAFYATPGVSQVMQILALNFVLIPFGIIPFAYLQRNMEFAPIYKAEILSALVGSVTAVVLALNGFTYLSLALAAVARNLTTILLVAVYRPAGLPYLPHFRGLRHVLDFGARATAAGVLSEIDKGAPDLILGRAISMSAVGYFGRASGLVQLFDRLLMNSVWPVALPYFSAEVRTGEGIRAAYLKSITYLTAIAWPFAVFLGVMAFPVIRVLFGSQWDTSVPITRWLALHFFIMCPFALTGCVLMALGKMNLLVRTSVVLVALKAAFLIAGASISLEAAAIAVVISAGLGFVIVFELMKKIIGFKLREFLESMESSAWITFWSAAGPITLSALLPPDPNYLVGYLASAALLAGIGWLASTIWLNHPLSAELFRLFTTIRDTLRPAKNR